MCYRALRDCRRASTEPAIQLINRRHHWLGINHRHTYLSVLIVNYLLQLYNISSIVKTAVGESVHSQVVVLILILVVLLLFDRNADANNSLTGGCYHQLVAFCYWNTCICRGREMCYGHTSITIRVRGPRRAVFTKCLQSQGLTADSRKQL